MADLHESLIVSFRRVLLRKHYSFVKSPMPTYRPDILAEKMRDGRRMQVVVEAEILSTLFTDHTLHQLVIMNEFIEHQKRKKVAVKGYLLVPPGKSLLSQANGLLESLFPENCEIVACQRYSE